MAKLSQVLRDEKRDALIEKYAARREELRRKLKDFDVPPEEKQAISAQLNKLPRNSCVTRKTRRCMLTGRSKAVYRKFGLCRVALRDLALRGDLPGVTKSSW
ncbi:MAG: 30S ribosomal protein S14 [Deltaproteobacteria bacterium]|jgi:small subunit ribosomal protein S14|nr:30S ribosomal protein S14 [Deltaproteobacteria bacterium]MBK8236450.1 30S ribosomal protein S14 [Deltaproteobacteria bacterium]MBK8717929.1 30S ribosomal protein S14 [Deltaproteobacteria bacterium]MBP7288326.1 30S ribosomal protein S14 [Nannocystaceae bacterium]